MSKVTPFLWFDGAVEEAADFYTSIFKSASIEMLNPGLSATFELEGQRFIAFNGGPHFKFNEAVSFFINCQDQEEVDYYWGELSEGGKIQMCGWLKDKFGLSWQVIPEILGELLSDEDREKAEKVKQAMLQMKKIDVDALLKAYEG